MTTTTEAVGRPTDAVTGSSRPAPPRSTATRPGRLRTGQVVVAQLALALLVVGVAGGTLWTVVTAPVAVVLLILAFGRVRRRWAYRWIALGARYLRRRRSLAPRAGPAALLDLLRPAGALTVIEIDSTPVGVIEDALGLTAMLEIGDTTGLLAEAQPAVAPPASLLPQASPDIPSVRLQLLVAGVAGPATRAGAATATSYRQLTEGRILAQQRVLLAVHVRRAGGFGAEDLRRSLTSAVRRVRRRLDRDKLPCRPLAGDSVLRALADLAHDDGGRGLRETWSAVELGGLRQACFRLTRWPDPQGARTLVPRLATLPGGGTTLSLAVERSGRDQAVRAELTIRLAAPTPGALAAAVEALYALIAAADARVERLDGAQADGLAATLPLGGAAGPSAALAGIVTDRGIVAEDAGLGIPVAAQAVADIELPVGGAGLMLGVNRHGEAVTIRLFRPEPTRAVLIGGLRCAQIIALRALAVGAHVIVQSGRPHAWEPFVRGVGGQGSALTLVAPGRVIEPPPAGPVQPQLLVVDVGPVGATGTGTPMIESAWRATLLLRDELTQADLDVLARADVALLQPLTGPEAVLASSALGLGGSAGWLTRIRADMVGVVVGRRTLRWALLSGTPIEEQLIGPPTR